MKKLSKHTCRLLCLVLVPVGLMIGVTLGPEPAGRVSAQILGPSWSVTGGLNTSRFGHTATLLRNGKVLVAGGHSHGRNDGTGDLNSAELYDPTSGTWSETGSLNKLRGTFRATILADGNVLVVGYIDDRQIVAEIYDSISGTWSVTGTPSDLHNLVLLPNGKVFSQNIWRHGDL